MLSLEAGRMKDQKKDHNVFKALALISQLGIGMLVPVFIGLFLGRWLDRFFGTEWLTVIFLIFGVLAAYRNLYYYTRPLIKGEKEKEKAFSVPETLFGAGLRVPDRRGQRHGLCLHQPDRRPNHPAAVQGSGKAGNPGGRGIG